MRGFGVAELGAQNGDSPSNQPAGEAVDQHQQHFMGKGAVRLSGVALFENDLRLRRVAEQRARNVIQDDAVEAQSAIQCLGQALAIQHRVAQQGKAARLHAAGILPEEFIVQGQRHPPPQFPVVLDRNPGLRHMQQAWIQPGPKQQLVGIEVSRPHAFKRRGDETDGDRAGFRPRELGDAFRTQRD